MAKANYERRRRNAFLAAIVMALVFIIIIVIMIVSIANKTGKKKDKDSELPTIQTTPTMFIPTFQPTASPTYDVSLPTDEDGTTPSPSATADVTPSVSGTVMYVTGEGVNVRDAASTSGEKITSLSKGTSVTAYDKSNGFYQVKLSNGKMGYISEKYLSTEDPKNEPTTSPTATPDTTQGTDKYVIGELVNVRSSASTSSQKVAQLKKGAKVTAYSTVTVNNVEWTYIEYQSGKYGYISSQYLADTADGKPTASASASATATAPTPTPTAPPALSFTTLGVAEKVAAVADNNTEYLNAAKTMTGWVNNASSGGKSYYRFSCKDGTVIECADVTEFYIVYEGAADAPTSVIISLTRP